MTLRLALFGNDTPDPGADIARSLLIKLRVALALPLFLLLLFFLLFFNSLELWLATGQKKQTEKPVSEDLIVHIALSSLRSLCCICRLSGMGKPRVETRKAGKVPLQDSYTNSPVSHVFNFFFSICWKHRVCVYVLVRQGVNHNNVDALSRHPCLSVHCRHCERLEIKEELATEEGRIW